MTNANEDKEQISAHLADVEWMKKLLLQNLQHKLRCITKEQNYSYDDRKEERKETTNHYPAKGLLLYSGETTSEFRGCPVTTRYKQPEFYLLETGEFATVESEWYSDTVRNSFYPDDYTYVTHTYTTIAIWTADEIEKNKEKLADSLLKLLRCPK